MNIGLALPELEGVGFERDGFVEIEAQLFGRRVEESARRMHPHVDFSAAESFAEVVCREGAGIFDDAMAGLRDIGVDTRNPLQMLYVLKKIGARNFEAMFAPDAGPGEQRSTDISNLARSVVAEHRALFSDAKLRRRIMGKRFMVASSDVHEHAAGALAQLLGEAGAEIVYLGAEQAPADLVAAMQRQPVDALLLSTHNGMALEYARQLKQLLHDAEIELPVIFGGVLNQKTAEQELPVPVGDELRALGIHPAKALPGLSRFLEWQP